MSANNPPERIEYNIVSGHIAIALEDGSYLPAYWAYPSVGGVFHGIALIHDWWGITEQERQMANRFAQGGYYVIVPDLYSGRVAHTAQEAMQLVEALGEDAGYTRVNMTLRVLETHHRCTHRVAAIGVGMGGSLAYGAALQRADLEAAIACSGFPQRYFGKFGSASTPIMALYGSADPYVRPAVVERLRRELAASPSADKHQVHVLEGAGRDFLAAETAAGNTAVLHTIYTFLDLHLGKQTTRTARKTY